MGGGARDDDDDEVSCGAEVESGSEVGDFPVMDRTAPLMLERRPSFSFPSPLVALLFRECEFPVEVGEFEVDVVELGAAVAREDWCL